MIGKKARRALRDLEAAREELAESVRHERLALVLLLLATLLLAVSVILAVITGNGAWQWLILAVIPPGAASFALSHQAWETVGGPAVTAVYGFEGTGQSETETSTQPRITARRRRYRRALAQYEETMLTEAQS